jgi:PleD family two-component response regulator
MISSSDILKTSILIVDDQEANVLPLERMLRSAGFVSIWTGIITFLLMVAVQKM